MTGKSAAAAVCAISPIKMKFSSLTKTEVLLIFKLQVRFVIETTFQFVLQIRKNWPLMRDDGLVREVIDGVDSVRFTRSRKP